MISQLNGAARAGIFAAFAAAVRMQAFFKVISPACIQGAVRTFQNIGIVHLKNIVAFLEESAQKKKSHIVFNDMALSSKHSIEQSGRELNLHIKNPAISFCSSL